MIQTRGVQVIVGRTLEALRHHEDPPGTHCIRQDHGAVTVDQTELTHQHKLWNDEHENRENHLHNQEITESVFASEFRFCQRIAHQHGGDGHTRGHGDRDEKRVKQRAQKRLIGPVAVIEKESVIFERQRARKEIRGINLCRRLQG